MSPLIWLTSVFRGHPPSYLIVYDLRMTSEQGPQRHSERITITLTRAQRQRLEKVARELDRPISWVMRIGMDMALEQYERGSVSRGTIVGLVK